MKIEKLPSGSYRIRKMYKGIIYTVICDYKPSTIEAMKLINESYQTSSYSGPITFKLAAEKYIELKKNVLSPRTLKEYSDTPSRLSDTFNKLKISEITQIDIQKEINILSIDKAPKTVRNYHGFISAILGMFRPELRISTTLPQKIKNEPYIPSDHDVKQVLEFSRGTMYEIPIILACYGLRRSEICAITGADVKNDVIHINKAKVLDSNNDWVIKTTKTVSSTRDIVIPLGIANQIKEQGYAYNGNPNNITDFLSAAEKKLDLPHFSIHKLRHYFASKLSAMNVPDVDIMKMGGWETDYVMKAVYRHAMNTNDVQREAARLLGNVLMN